MTNPSMQEHALQELDRQIREADDRLRDLILLSRPEGPGAAQGSIMVAEQRLHANATLEALKERREALRRGGLSNGSAG